MASMAKTVDTGWQTLTVRVPAGVARRLAEEAARAGVDREAFAAQAIESFIEPGIIGLNVDTCDSAMLDDDDRAAIARSKAQFARGESSTTEEVMARMDAIIAAAAAAK